MTLLTQAEEYWKMSRTLRKEMTYISDMLNLWSYMVGLWKDHWFGINKN